MSRSQHDRQRMLNAFADPEASDSIELSIIRDKGDNLTFTDGVMDQFKDDVFLFIGGRLCAFQDKTNKPAQKVTVKITVEVETLVT